MDICLCISTIKNNCLRLFCKAVEAHIKQLRLLCKAIEVNIKFMLIYWISRHPFLITSGIYIFLSDSIESLYASYKHCWNCVVNIHMAPQPWSEFTCMTDWDLCHFWAMWCQRCTVVTLVSDLLSSPVYFYLIFTKKNNQVVLANIHVVIETPI